MDLRVYFYTKENCLLCEEALSLLNILKELYGFTLIKRDIYTNDEWLENYHLRIPVVSINGVELDGDQIDFHVIENLLKKGYE